MPLSYQLSRLSGRLIGSSARRAFNPQAFTPVERIPIMTTSAGERPMPVRGMSDMKTALHSAPVIQQSDIYGEFPDNARYRRLQEKQRIMTRPDGKLVWQKLPSDRVQYLLSWAIVFVGLAMTAELFYKMAFNMKPPSKDAE